MRRRIFLALLLLAIAACRREQRELRHAPPASNADAGPVRLTELQPGPPNPEVTVRNRSEERAWDLSEGKRLYSAYNCVGCHSHGGGGMGPPLMDSYWIYGSTPENVYDTIKHGRPNGMPAFGDKVPDYQIWEIAAYVRSMAGLVPKNPSPARGDEMMTHIPPQSKKEEVVKR